MAIHSHCNNNTKKSKRKNDLVAIHSHKNTNEIYNERDISFIWINYLVAIHSHKTKQNKKFKRYINIEDEYDGGGSIKTKNEKNNDTLSGNPQPRNTNIY